jgi:serine/threonine protein kinase
MSRARYCPRCLTTFAEDPPRCPNLGCGAPVVDGGWPSLLASGDVLDRTYQILERLAGGAAGMTYLAREVDGDGGLVGPELAIKVLYQQRDSGPFLRRLATEAQILQELAHPHIVECLGFVHRAGRPPYLITRFEPGGTLHGHVADLGPLHPAVAASVVTQILDALEVAHRADIVHRDLKPGNILLRARTPAHEVPTVLLADFGVARVSGSLGGMTRVGTFVGTPEYASPEQFLGVEPTGAADLFAAGAVLWFCVTGEAPFRFSHRHDPSQCHDELVALLPPPLPPAIAATPAGQALQPVLDGLLLPDPSHRWTSAQARAALRDVIRRTIGEQQRAPASTPGAAAEPTSHFEDPHGTFFWEDQDVAPNLGVGGTLFVAPARRDRPTPAPTDGPTEAPTRSPRSTAPSLAPTEAPTRRARSTAPTAAPRDLGPVSSMEGLFDFTDAAPEPTPSTGGSPGRAADAFAAPELDDPPSTARPAGPAAPPPADAPGEATRLGAAPPGTIDPFDAPRAPSPRDPPMGSVFDPDDPTLAEPEPAEPDPFDAFFGAPPTPRQLLAALADPTDAATLGALRDLDERALSEALRQARTDDDPRVRRGAAIAAGALARAEQISMLRTLLRDPAAPVRAAAAAALGAVGQGSALPVLARVLEDLDPHVRAAAALALGQAYARDGDVRRGRQQLARLGTDRDPEVRRAFAAALAHLDRFGS